MAILTTSGRAALAAAIKAQTLHLALGEGDPLWDTTKAISTPFDEAGVIALGFTHLADIRVTSLDDQTEYLLDGDYSANAREGVIRRLPASTIPEGGDVTVHFKIEHPPESIGQTALLREVGRRVVDEVLLLVVPLLLSLLSLVVTCPELTSVSVMPWRCRLR